MSFVPHEKVSGSPTGMFNPRDEDLNHFFFPNESFGVRGIQQIALTVDQATKDAFTNGSVDDLVAIINANGMQVQYLRIYWNEYPNNEIRDVDVGVVVKAIGSQDITAQRLLNVMSFVNWYKGLASKLSVSWAVYGMSFPPLAHPPDVQYTWLAEWKSGLYQFRSLSGVPPPPPVSDVQSHFINDGQVDSALGGFVRDMLDKGYQITLSGYEVKVTFETVRVWQQQDNTWAEYRTHVQLTVQFTTTPELATLMGAALMWAIGRAIAIIILAILVGVSVYVALNNLTSTEKHYEKWGWVQNPDTGAWEWKIVETGTERAPPDWWGTVFIIVGLGVGGFIVYKIFQGGKK